MYTKINVYRNKSHSKFQSLCIFLSRVGKPESKLSPVISRSREQSGRRKKNQITRYGRQGNGLVWDFVIWKSQFFAFIFILSLFLALCHNDFSLFSLSFFLFISPHGSAPTFSPFYLINICSCKRSHTSIVTLNNLVYLISSVKTYDIFHLANLKPLVFFSSSTLDGDTCLCIIGVPWRWLHIMGCLSMKEMGIGARLWVWETPFINGVTDTGCVNS